MLNVKFAMFFFLAAEVMGGFIKFKDLLVLLPPSLVIGELCWVIGLC
jgi:hypothetical protein